MILYDNDASFILTSVPPKHILSSMAYQWAWRHIEILFSPWYAIIILSYYALYSASDEGLSYLDAYATLKYWATAKPIKASTMPEYSSMIIIILLRLILVGIIRILALMWLDWEINGLDDNYRCAIEIMASHALWPRMKFGVKPVIFILEMA